jgi:hypothetical protein
MGKALTFESAAAASAASIVARSRPIGNTPSFAKISSVLCQVAPSRKSRYRSTDARTARSDLPQHVRLRL